MQTDTNRDRRRSIRLKGYDYSQEGAYFVTICTKGRAQLVGDVENGVMQENDAGQVAEQCWLDIPKHFPRVKLDTFVVMPNHLHGIIVLSDRTVGAKYFSPSDDRGTPPRRPSGTGSGTIGSILRGFKIGVTQWFRQQGVRETVWQRNYYEHVIRNEASLDRVRQYILNNPAQWEFDRENPAAANKEPENVWLA